MTRPTHSEALLFARGGDCELLALLEYVERTRLPLAVARKQLVVAAETMRQLAEALRCGAR